MSNSEIYDYLNTLKGKHVRDIGRSANIIWLSLGETIKALDYKGNEIYTGAFSLNVQCPCRMLNKEKRSILFASSDIYEPNSLTEWTENFEWDVQGINLFDEKSKKWIESNECIYVNDFQLNIFGDLKLTLSNGNIFEALINSSSGCECWRLFERNSKKDHFVVNGNGVVFETKQSNP